MNKEQEELYIFMTQRFYANSKIFIFDITPQETKEKAFELIKKDLKELEEELISTE